MPDENDPASVTLQQENEAAYRDLLVQGILAILLPTEDLENTCLTSLVGGILSDMIIGNGIGGKACEPWVIWEGILKITEVAQKQISKDKAEGRSEQELEGLKVQGVDAAKKSRWSIQTTFWLLLQCAFFAFTTIRLIIVTITTSSSLPRRTPLAKIYGSSPVRDDLQAPASPYSTISSSSRISTAKQVSKQPILSMKIWPCLSDLLELDIRMPWLSASLSLLQWGALRGPGRLGETDGMVDRYVVFPHPCPYAL